MSVPGYDIGRDERGATKREREVLDLMVEELSFEEIGRRLGVSKQRVGQIALALAKKGLLIRSARGYGLPLAVVAAERRQAAGGAQLLT